MKRKRLFTSTLALTSALILGACSGGAATTTTAGSTAGTTTAAGTTAAATTTAAVTKVKVGVLGSKHELWDKIKENLAAENINVELVEFLEYTPINKALQDGDLDLNSFQHHIYFDDFNKANGNKLVSLGDTFLSPIGLYSKKYKAPAELKEGDTIAIPDDPTNAGRALKVLESAGLIKLKDPDNMAPSQADIVENAKKLVIEELDAAQTARSLEDVAASIINTDMAVDAGLSPAKDAIFLEPVTDKVQPYFNLIAARAEDKDNAVYKRIVKEYQSQAIGELMLQVYDGAQFPVWEGFVMPKAAP